MFAFSGTSVLVSGEMFSAELNIGSSLDSTFSTSASYFSLILSFLFCSGVISFLGSALSSSSSRFCSITSISAFLVSSTSFDFSF